MLTVGAVGLASKLFLRLGCSEVHVNGLPILLDALKEENRRGQGIITGMGFWCSHLLTRQ